jgi:type II secretory pathway component PulF
VTPERDRALPAVIWPAALGALAMLVALGLRLVVAPSFAGMFSDLGGELPWVTRQFVSGWLGVALALAGSVFAILVARHSVVGGVVAGGGTVLLSVIAFLLAVYLPIFAIAGTIR